MSKNNIDVETVLNQTEAGRVKTILHGQGVRVRYRELIAFSPRDVAKLKACKDHAITPQRIADAAGRAAILEVSNE